MLLNHIQKIYQVMHYLNEITIKKFSQYMYYIGLIIKIK